MTGILGGMARRDTQLFTNGAHPVARELAPARLRSSRKTGNRDDLMDHVCWF